MNKTQVLTLIDSKIEVNTIHLSFVKELGFPIKSTEVGGQKINGTILDIYEIIVTVFSVIYKANQVRYFKMTFVMGNINPKVVFRIFFLTLSSANVDFSDWKLR